MYVSAEVYDDPEIETIVHVLCTDTISSLDQTPVDISYPVSYS